MRATKIFAPLLLLAVAPWGTAFAQEPPEKSAAIHLAGMLANDARDVLRDTALPPDAAAVQATVLLQAAVTLDASDVRTWRLLAETARVAGKADVQKEALRKVIAADAGDLVSQVRYIDLLAAASQTMEERAAVYQKVLAEASLDRQIRSEVAVRLGRLAEGRGDLAQARNYLGQAVQLNDVNVGALRDLVRLAAQDTSPDAAGRHLRTLVTLLTTNPYQADAWLQLARLCEAVGVHDRAGEFLETGGEKLATDGGSITGDFRLELALENGISGQPVQGFRLAEGLAELPDAPLGALLVAELLAQNLAATGTALPPAATQGATPSATAATQPAFQRGAEIRKRLTEMAKQTDNPAALADAAGADLTVLATPGPDTAAWIDAYAKLVAPEDVTLARLRGWMLFRQGKLDEARATLEKIAESDPLARVGVARILISQNKAAQGGKILQELWAGNPTGLLALQVALTAQKAKLTLADSAAAAAMRTAIAKLTPALMHFQPLDLQLVKASFRKDTGAGTVSTGVGEPVLLQIRVTNISGRALPVGPEGMVKSTVGLAAATRTSSTTNPTLVGLYAIEDLQRVYRLDPQQMMESTVRVDQGKLEDMFQQNPEGTFDVNLTVVTAPRVLGSTQYSVGVGGQVVFPGDFRHVGLPLLSKAEWDRLTQDVATANGDKQLVRIEVAAAVLAGSADDALKGKLATALTALAAAPDARVRAALVRALPTEGISAELEKAVGALASDPDPLVRLLWATRAGRIALGGGARGVEAVGTLEKQAGLEKDEGVRQWIAAELPVVKAKK